MNKAQALHDLGQSLWLDNITRPMLDSGTLERYIREFAITGLTSNPTIFEHAIGQSDAYDEAIRKKTQQGHSGEALFFELALEDLRRAADLFRPVFDATDGVDGWVSLEVSPLLAHDAVQTIAAVTHLHALAERPNVYIKIPGTPEGVVAIEESIFAGIPINVTLLFSPAQYQAAVEAYLRGIARRIAAGLNPRVHSVASLFVSRWDVAANQTLPAHLHNRLGIAVAAQTYQAYRTLLDSARWHKMAAAGACTQRLLWASTGTKDPSAPDTLYIDALAAPDTINTMPEKTLLAFAEHGRAQQALAGDGNGADAVMAACRQAGIDPDALAERLQDDGAQAFSSSWSSLLEHIAHKALAFTQAAVR
ncbi:transaldolase [Rhodococcus sp. SRB_17]|uniref:transaldolase n=1 Tax=Acidovorax sp. SRB_24 TaxID=1962700 RepID=UPI00145CEACB|nr:transaldolase [Acidovorax sp. SRB_24]NMM77310.1 transaldolase [Acidovorax sp. SRB_24]NMM89813.1 transaldolase [Rhodococcus sp. SRB_17]